MEGRIEVRLVGGEAFTKANRGFASVRRNMQQMGRGVSRVSTRFRTMAADAKQTALRVVSGLRRIIDVVTRMTIVVGIAAVAFAFAYKRIQGAVITTAQTFEGLEAQMEIIWGEQAGRRMFQWAIEFSKPLAFTTEGVVRAAITLKNFGLEAQKWLPLIGDLAGGMGRDISEAAYAVGGAFTGEFERLKLFGITSRMLLERGAPGKAGAGIAVRSAQDLAMLEKALQRIISERFTGGMARFAKTLTGLQKTWESLVDIFKMQVGGAGLLDTVKRSVQVAIDAMSRLLEGDIFKRFSKLFSQFLEWWPTFTDSFMARIPEIFESLTGALQGFMGRVGDPKQWGERVAQWFIDVFADLPGAVTGAAEAVTGAANKVAAMLPDMETITTKLKGWVEELPSPEEALARFGYRLEQAAGALDFFVAIALGASASANRARLSGKGRALAQKERLHEWVGKWGRRIGDLPPHFPGDAERKAERERKHAEEGRVLREDRRDYEQQLRTTDEQARRASEAWERMGRHGYRMLQYEKQAGQVAGQPDYQIRPVGTGYMTPEQYQQWRGKNPWFDPKAPGQMPVVKIIIEDGAIDKDKIKAEATGVNVEIIQQERMSLGLAH